MKREMDLELKVRQGRLSLHKKIWPTLHGGWRLGADVLTDRDSRDIQTAVKHEMRTCNPSLPTNIRLLEWLMNLPADLTRTE